jgi:hypothetical protein
MASSVQDITLALGINLLPVISGGFTLHNVTVEPNCLTNGLYYDKLGYVSIGYDNGVSDYNSGDFLYAEMMYRRLMGYGFNWQQESVLTAIGAVQWLMRINSLHAGIPCHVIWTHA